MLPNKDSTCMLNYLKKLRHVFFGGGVIKLHQKIIKNKAEVKGPPWKTKI